MNLEMKGGHDGKRLWLWWVQSAASATVRRGTTLAKHERCPDTCCSSRKGR